MTELELISNTYSTGHMFLRYKHLNELRAHDDRPPVQDIEHIYI